MKSLPAWFMGGSKKELLLVFTGASDTAADGVHPLASGYAKIATYFGSIVS